MPRVRRAYGAQGIGYTGGVMYYPGSSPAAKRRKLSDAGLAFALPPSSRRRRRRSMNARTGGFAGIELKFLDTGIADTAIVSNVTDASGGEMDPATFLCLNATAQGDGEQNRDGRVQRNVSLELRGNIHLPNVEDSGVAPSTVSVFLAVVEDRQTNAAQLQSEQVFSNPTADTGGSDCVFPDLENRQRFKILWSMRRALRYHAAGTDGAGITSAYAGERVPFSCFIPLNTTTNYLSGGTTAVIASIADISYHVIAFTSIASTAATLTYSSRLRFRA